MSIPNASDRLRSRQMNCSKGRLSGCGGPARSRGKPTSSQASAIVQLVSTLQAHPVCANLISGPPETGKSAVVRVAVRRAGKEPIFYQCTNGSSANRNLKNMISLIEVGGCEPDGSKVLVLVVEHVERSTCCEALIGATKRMAAEAGIAVVFEVADDVRGSDAVHAYCRRTRRLFTSAPRTITRMSSRDAQEMTRNCWRLQYPGRYTPEYLSETLRTISDGKVGVFPDVWRFAVTLFDNATFVEPARLWEYLRPADEADGQTVDKPHWPWPFFPDRRLIFEVEAFLDTLGAVS